MNDGVLPEIIFPAWFGDMQDGCERTPNSTLRLSISDVVRKSPDGIQEMDGSVHFVYGECRVECRTFFTGGQVRVWYEELHDVQNGQLDVCHFQDIDHLLALSFSRNSTGGILMAGELALCEPLCPRLLFPDAAFSQQADKDSSPIAGVRVVFGNGLIQDEEVWKLLSGIATWLRQIGD